MPKSDRSIATSDPLPLLTAMFTFESGELTDSIRAHTFERDGALVVVIQILSERMTDADTTNAIACLRRFVKQMKVTPMPFHMILDGHNVQTLPIERVIPLYEYLARKEAHLRPYSRSSTYVVQGRLARLFIETLDGMFGSWANATRTFECSSTHDHELPAEVHREIMAFIDNVAPRKE